MPRYVVLRHETPPGYPRPLHWDLMLEAGDKLLTWALAEEPNWNRNMAAESLADHRREYLDYEGEVSGGRGTICRWDSGDFEWIEDAPDRRAVACRGRLGRYRITLARASGSGGWQVVFIRSSAADD